MRVLRAAGCREGEIIFRRKRMPTTKLKQRGKQGKLPRRRTVHKLVQVLPLEPRHVDEVGTSQRELAARVAEVRGPVGEDEVVLHVFLGWNWRKRERESCFFFCVCEAAIDS